jgi:hypothetical protein
VIVTAAMLGTWAVIGVLLPNSGGRYAKSNVAAVAQAVAPRLRPGDVVVLTQTEQLAVVHHYLPGGLTYVTPTGPVADPSVVDWRSIVTRLEKASPCLAVGPSVGALPVGAHVLEIDPARRLGATGTAWSRAVNAQVEAVHAFLTRDPSLTPVGIYAPAAEPRPFSPVDGLLFQKTSARPACA